MQVMNLEQLRATVDAGGVSGVTLKGEGSTFYLSVQTRKGIEAIVVTAKGRAGQPPQPRRFVDPRKAMLLLRGLGISEFRIDSTEWYPEQGALERSRPDRAQALRATHAAAQHDQWFRAEVEQALAEAEHPATRWVSNDQAREGWERKRAELLRRAEETGA